MTGNELLSRLLELPAELHDSPTYLIDWHISSLEKVHQAAVVDINTYERMDGDLIEHLQEAESLINTKRIVSSVKGIYLDNQKANNESTPITAGAMLSQLQSLSPELREGRICVLNEHLLSLEEVTRFEIIDVARCEMENGEIEELSKYTIGSEPKRVLSRSKGILLDYRDLEQ